jgi:predicted HTH transcriptional regulator
MVELSDLDLLSKLKNCEDTFVERKTAADSKDWLKTVVAFANSTPIGYPAVLFIGVKDDGTIEARSKNFDSLQKTLNKKMEDAYPTIFYITKVLNQDSGQCLAVVVPGSEGRPHFAGPSYVRVGSETRVASESEFDNLIAERQSKPYEILRWKGKQVTVDHMNTERATRILGVVALTDVLTVVACNPFYATLQKPPAQQVCIPLNRIGIAFDPEMNRLKLEIAPV